MNQNSFVNPIMKLQPVQIGMNNGLPIVNNNLFSDDEKKSTTVQRTPYNNNNNNNSSDRQNYQRQYNPKTYYNAGHRKFNYGRQPGNQNQNSNFQYEVSLHQQSDDVKQFVPLAVARNYQHERKLNKNK